MNTLKRTLALFCMMVLCVFAGVVACTRTPEEPPQDGSARIVALSPAIGIILRDMGLAERVVGRHAFDQFLPRQIPPCGDQSGIDMERLIACRPTHVFTQWGSRDLPGDLLAQAKHRNWVVANIEILSLADITRAVMTIDRLMHPGDTQELSPRAAALVDQLAASLRPDEAPPHIAGTVLLLASTEPLAALGPGSCHHETLLALGATPAIAQGAPYINLDAEDLLRLDPDSIVLVLPRPEGAMRYRLEPAMLLNAAGFAGLRAVERGRVELIDHPEALIPSTSMIHFATDLRAALRRRGDESPGGAAGPHEQPREAQDQE